MNRWTDRLEDIKTHGEKRPQTEGGKSDIQTEGQQERREIKRRAERQTPKQMDGKTVRLMDGKRWPERWTDKQQVRQTGKEDSLTDRKRLTDRPEKTDR